ncbi:hypothetical protein BH11CYA1_BH11CYA1_19340 [soil metagenome]
MSLNRVFPVTTLAKGAAALFTSTLALLLSTYSCPQAWSQSPLPGGAPRPGRYSSEESQSSPETSNNTNPANYTTESQISSGASTSTSAGAPAKGRYHQLPLTASDAKQKLDELRLALAVSRAQDVQDGIYEMVEWLQDAADAHYRMANAFTKVDAKREAASERQLTSKFGQLKREALLLKADVLIKQKRAPEALTPLVDIVIADPKGTTGVAAYHRLQDLGFSQELPSDIASNSLVHAPSSSGVRSGGK